jgi:hypothetical protein
MMKVMKVVACIRRIDDIIVGAVNAGTWSR